MRKNIPSWNQYFFNIVEVIKTKSKDEETQVGCVIVDKNNRIVSTGFNGFPAGCDDEKLPATRPDKYPFMVHSEINALLYARTSVVGFSLFCSISPCSDCTKAIITAGIEKVFFKQKYADFDNTFYVWESCGYRLETQEDFYVLTKESVQFEKDWNYSL